MVTEDPTSTETTRPIVGITQAPAPCFYPEDENGLAFEWGDGTPHWTTASEAWRMLGVIRRDDRGLVLRLRRETKPCWHVACDECGYRYDEDEWCCHFGSQVEAQAAAEDSDWHTVEGRLLCSECATEGGVFGDDPPIHVLLTTPSVVEGS